MSVVLMILLIICLIYIFLLKKQINAIRQQLTYIRKNETNKIVTKEINNKTTNQLIEEINLWIDDIKTDRLDYQLKNEQIMDTISMISHDIRTPLTSLDGYFKLIETESNVAYKKIVQDKIDELKVLLEELFTYVKLKNDNYNIKNERININEVFYRCLGSFYQVFKQCEVEPDLKIPEDSIYVYGNDLALQSVFENIIKNSLEHGGKMFNVVFDLHYECLKITVVNDLVGDTKLNIDQVFERFYKADLSRSKSSSGLGLAITKGFMEKMDGRIEAFVESDCFKLVLYFKVV